MEKRQELYRGKAKTAYATDDPGRLVMHFRDDTSAFDGTKVSQLAQKGETNNRINAFIMGKLAAAGVATHFRNVCAGSMAKRYGIAEGTRLSEPIFEFFYKSDALHDPLVNDDHLRVLGWANATEIAEMKSLTHRVNQVLKPLFADAGIELVDYKLEFGHAVSDPAGPLLLGDEFTPDGCRLWDLATQEKMDKDRFRRDLGSVIEKYQEVAKRIGVPLS